MSTYAERQAAGLEALRKIAVEQARGRARDRRRRPWTRAFKSAAVAAAIAAVLAVAPNGASAKDVGTYGTPFCGKNAWSWLETTPRMQVHDSAGSCVEAPSKYRAAMTVTKAPNNDSYPNISSGSELGLSGCPSAYDAAHGICLHYPDRAGGNQNPIASVRAWNAPDYQGNLSFDMWFSPRHETGSYQSRCSSDLSKSYTEIMVWLAHPADLAYSSGYTTRIGGRRWHVMEWATAHHCPPGQRWRLVIFMAPRMTDGPVTVHNLKLNDFWRYSIGQGWLRNSEWNTAIDLGWEMHHGGTGNTISSWTLRSGRTPARHS